MRAGVRRAAATPCALLACGISTFTAGEFMDVSSDASKRQETLGVGDATDDGDVGEGPSVSEPRVVAAACSAARSGTQGLASPELLAGLEYPVESALGDSAYSAG